MGFVENSELSGQIKKLKEASSTKTKIIHVPAENSPNPTDDPETTFLPRSLSSQQAIKTLKTNLEHATNSNQNLTSKNDELTNSSEKIKTNFINLEKILNTKNDKLKKLEDQNSKLKSENKQMKFENNKIPSLESKIGQLEKIKENYETDMETVIKNLEDSNERYKKTKTLIEKKIVY